VKAKIGENSLYFPQRSGIGSRDAFAAASQHSQPKTLI